MALGAMVSDPKLRVQVVPVGLSYFHPDRFRSRAVIEFGRAFEVPGDLVEMFQQGGDGKRTAVAKLLDLIYDGLKTVTVRAPDWETLMVSGGSNPPNALA
jgi:glycerol-3-phosphate O-acyltransferase/dihydroxyacetone phosphate acyltransferase